MIPSRTFATIIMSLGIVVWADDTSLDSNGMSALNHARVDFDDCEGFTDLKNSGMVEYDYIDQILAGKTRHSADVARRIKAIREQFKRIAKQLGTATKHRNRRVYDLLKDVNFQDCEECDPPVTEETWEITAYYFHDTLIKIEWLYATNWPTEDTTAIFFDSMQRPVFAFKRRSDQTRQQSQTRFYYDEKGRTIAVATRNGWENDRRCESKSVPSVDLLKNYPAPLNEPGNPIDQMDHLDEMICTAKQKPGCNYQRNRP